MMSLARRCIVFRGNPLLAVLVLLVSATPAHAAWKSFGESPRLNAYYEPPTLVKGRTIGRVLFDYKEEQVSKVSGRRYRTEIAHYEVECTPRRSRVVFVAWYEGPMATGKIVYTSMKTREWNPDAPGTINNGIFNVVCTR